MIIKDSNADDQPLKHGHIPMINSRERAYECCCVSRNNNNGWVIYVSSTRRDSGTTWTDNNANQRIRRYYPRFVFEPKCCMMVTMSRIWIPLLRSLIHTLSSSHINDIRASSSTLQKIQFPALRTWILFLTPILLARLHAKRPVGDVITCYQVMDVISSSSTFLFNAHWLFFKWGCSVGVLVIMYSPYCYGHVSSVYSILIFLALLC